jgi:hypothetical protein
MANYIYLRSCIKEWYSYKMRIGTINVAYNIIQTVHIGDPSLLSFSGFQHITYALWRYVFTSCETDPKSLINLRY